MSTLLEILAQLAPEQMREGESITVVDGTGREVRIIFGPMATAEQQAGGLFEIGVSESTRNPAS